MHHVEVVAQLEANHLAQLPDLLHAATRADGHEPIGEHKFLRLHRGDDLALALLAFDDERLVGYGHTLTYLSGEDRRVSCELVVHPDERGHGIGGLLLSQAVTHARAQSVARIDVWSYNDSPASARLSERWGFRPSRRLFHLHRHMRDLPPEQRAPGFTFRAFHPGADDEAWLTLNNRIFADHPENGAWTLDDLRARMAQPWFAPGDFLLAEGEGGVLAGYCWLKVEDRPDEGLVGEVYVIGTASETRGRGLGKALIARALRHLRSRGAHIAAIYVDEANAPALRLYEAAAFHYHHADVCYTRDLAESANAPLTAEAAA